MTNVEENITSYLAKCFNEMPLLNDLCSGSISKEELKQIAMLQYAETKTFTDIKNPARLYLCPHEATLAKKYFCYLYREEQGNFKEGMNHADLFKPVCFDLGLTEKQIEDCYDKYSRTFLYLFHEKPSMEVMVRELGISVAWESLTPYFGKGLIDSLKENYHLSDAAMKYFTIHHSVDQAHSKHAIKTLAHYCIDERMLSIAKQGIKSALIDDLHLLRPYKLKQ